MPVVNDSNLQPIDVIAIHYKNGKMAPYKIKVIDEDGFSQEYLIKKYDDMTSYISRDENEYKARNNIWSYNCLIQTFDTYKKIHIIFNANRNIWFLKR